MFGGEFGDAFPWDDSADGGALREDVRFDGGRVGGNLHGFGVFS